MNVNVIPASYWCLYMTQGIQNIVGEDKAVRMAEKFPDVIVFRAELIEPIDPEFVIKLQSDVKSLEERLREIYKTAEARSALLPYMTDSTKPKPWWKRWRSWL